MPMYEYQCTACGHRFEVIQKFSDQPVKKCPHCGKAGKAVERLVSSSAIQFKGSGWYVTDYAKKGKSDGQAAQKDDGAKADGAKADGAKTEAAAKADAAGKTETKGESGAKSDKASGAA